MKRNTFSYKNKRYDFRYSTEHELIKKVVKAVEETFALTSLNDTPLFKEWCFEWLEVYKQPTISEETYKSYVQRINKHLIPAFGEKMLHEITPRECQLFFSRLRGYADNTIHKIYNDMNCIMEKAVVLRMLEDNPLAHVELPKGYASSRRAITPLERKIILQVAEYHHARYMVLLMLFCGLRTHETALIQGKDVVGNKLHIRGIKNAVSDRWVPIPDVLLKELPSLEPEEYLVKTATGKAPVDKAGRAKLWNSFKREMNIVSGCKVYRNKLIAPYPIAEDLVPYCLRHTYCTDLQDAGVPINIAKDFMGHSTIALTSKIYTHQTETSFKRSSDLINNFATSMPHSMVNMGQMNLTTNVMSCYG